VGRTPRRVPVLAVLGVFLGIATKHIATIAVPFQVAGHIALITGIVFSVTWGPVLILLAFIGLAMLWQVGRTAGGAMWDMASKHDAEDTGIVITADTIALALQHVDKIPALKKAYKDGWMPTFTQQPVKDGRGYFAIHSLPLGVTATMICDQRAVMARNLHRAEIETWPTDAERAGLGPAGYIAWWIADRGVLDKPAPEYPLLHDGTAGVFEGVPGGIVARGDGVLIPIVANNGVAGGQMGQGKSNLCRVVFLGCSLDPIAELSVFVFANNGDFDAYRPRVARYHKGIDDATAAAAVTRLQWLYGEVGRREARLAEVGAKKVARQLAMQYEDLHPLVDLYSECHELFGHPEYGAVAGDLATKILKRARKTAVSLWFDTQSSRKEAIPPKLVELVSVNCCFYVKSWRSNDGFLGDGSFAAGIRATELRPGRDLGTTVTTGIGDGQFELVKWYYIEVDDDTGFDAATDVIARAMTKVARGIPVEATAPAIVAEQRDLLETWTPWSALSASVSLTFPRCCVSMRRAGSRTGHSPGHS
jgi:DNA segregation ATPase FtsK/SpoIIIE, S-DNA-T family